MAVWQVRVSEVCRQIVPDSNAEGSVAEVGACPTDEKCVSVVVTLFFDVIIVVKNR